MTEHFGINQGLVEELYRQYLENPRLVDDGWRQYFDEREGTAARAPHDDDARPASDVAHANAAVRPVPPRTRAALSGRVYQLITAYRFLGHLAAHINPLAGPPPLPRELDYKSYGFTEADLDEEFPAIDLPGAESQTLRGIIDCMQDTYCRSIGVEYRAIESSEERHWLQERMEATKNRLRLDREAQVQLLTKLSDAEILEQFIHSSYGAGTKRFSLEGAESLIPLLDMIIERGAAHGIEEIVFGMAHRGRLNVLVNTLEMRLSEIFYAFEDKDAERRLGRGDVKYHLGFSNDRVTQHGRRVHLTMTFNPSHLEFVDPVVEGRVRAKQDRAGDTERSRIMPLLIHGDASFVGQGVVAETLNLSGLRHYATGGTVHVIVNNQIGFTTDPCDSRSTRYASDMMKTFNVPVFHVNGEDPEAVAQAAHLAVEYRQRFSKDVLIDLYCFRRHGHNEGDEPRFTQPVMYKVIDQKPSVRQMYVRHLVGLGQLDEASAEAITARRRIALAAALEEVKHDAFVPPSAAMGGVWQGFAGGSDRDSLEVATAVPKAELLRLSEKLCHIEEGFSPHRKVLQLLQQRHQRISDGEPFDWGAAELLAYATLLAEGTSIRISGQDVHRGTFSHRHSLLFDQRTGAPYSPLDHLAEKQGLFESCNGPLSEVAVLGFDFGYSLDSPDKLIIWEAQFGDFLNVAQVIVDQFLASCEDKWMRLSGLTLYLPHGYEGQGPEHSSARLERFMQSAAEDNMQICNLTTPAQLFHVLRRQVRRPYRKPLVILTPKSLLRAAYASPGPKPVSTIDDLANGRFQRVITDDVVEPAAVRKVLVCSGKIYYDLARHRFEHGIKDIAIVRLEQLYPLNRELTDALAPFPPGTPLVWVQEEPWNYGAWFFIQATLPAFVGGRSPLGPVVCRDASASPATGSKASHTLEQRRLVEQAFA
ncbi:MAG: 2-oxoglutarate dehydrogenase E1 component [Myxococcales bacterium]|nr:2-oxoglutarate dehydrogenase E1 component [Myxococcales bacterium]